MWILGLKGLNWYQLEGGVLVIEHFNCKKFPVPLIFFMEGMFLHVAFQ